MVYMEESYFIRIALLGEEMPSLQFKTNAVCHYSLWMVNCSMKSGVEISQNTITQCAVKVTCNIQMWLKYVRPWSKVLFHMRKSEEKPPSELTWGICLWSLVIYVSPFCCHFTKGATSSHKNRVLHWSTLQSKPEQQLLLALANSSEKQVNRHLGGRSRLDIWKTRWLRVKSRQTSARRCCVTRPICGSADKYPKQIGDFNCSHGIASLWGDPARCSQPFCYPGF